MATDQIVEIPQSELDALHARIIALETREVLLTSALELGMKLLRDGRPRAYPTMSLSIDEENFYLQYYLCITKERQ